MMFENPNTALAIGQFFSQVITVIGFVVVLVFKIRSDERIKIEKEKTKRAQIHANTDVHAITRGQSQASGNQTPEQDERGLRKP